MSPYTLSYIQKLLKEEESINQQYFLGFNSSENTTSKIELIQKESETVINDIHRLDINESAYTEDSYNDIEGIDVEEIEMILSEDFANYASEVIEENFDLLESLLEDYDIEIQEEFVEEKERIKKSLFGDINLDTMSDEYYDISQKLQIIQKSIEEASKEKDRLEDKIEELEETERNIEYIEENEEEYEEEYDNALEQSRNEYSELEEEVESLKSNLKDFYRDIDWTLDEIKSLLDKNKYVEKIIEKIEEYEANVYDELIDKLQEKEPELLKNQSKRFIESNNSIESFLKNKEEENLLDHIVLSKSEEIQEAKFFQDKSIAIKTKEGWESVIEGTYSYFRASMDLSKSMISHKCRKKPKYKELFLKAFNKDNNIETTLDTIDYFFKLEPVLKNKDFDLNKLKNKKSEYIYDELMKIEKEHKIEQYAKKLLSNKYKHFITENSLKLFKEIVELDIPKSHVQENIGKKLAAFHSVEQFEKGLMAYVNSINEFDKESVKLKSENQNSEIILEKDNILILKIKSFEASKKLGEGTSWCISRTESFFNNYVKSNNNHQYFVYDFSKDSKSRESRIGITIKPNGDHRAAHYKNDNIASVMEIKEFKKKILQADTEIQKTLSEENKELFEVKIEPKLNWANEDNAKRNYNYKSNNLVMLEVKIEDLMKHTFSNQKLDLNDPNGGENAKPIRIEKAKEHFLQGNPMDLPEVGCNDSGTAIGFTDGRHRTLAAYQLGADFIPMFVEKENLDSFKKMVETREIESKLNNQKQNKVKLR
tara:strand:+ start:13803 stop:16106 length:2304 start_codon:yes stop_codon:yes gene_type:complete